MMLKSLATIGLITLCGSVAAQHSGVSDNVVKIGLILDMSSLYADITGVGSVNAAKMAIEDFGGKVVGKPIELVYADHQNKPDIAASRAREWFDREKVDAILDVAASAPALAVAEVAREKNRVVVFSGPGSVRLTNEACTPSTVHYVYDTYALANATGRAVVGKGGDTWFFLTADYAFGQALERDTTEVVNANGGKLLRWPSVSSQSQDGMAGRLPNNCCRSSSCTM